MSFCITSINKWEIFQPEFIKQLSTVLATPTYANFVRQAAGLQLKNALVAKEEATRNEYLRRFLHILPFLNRPYRNVTSMSFTQKRRSIDLVQPSFITGVCLFACLLSSTTNRSDPNSFWYLSIIRILNSIIDFGYFEMDIITGGCTRIREAKCCSHTWHWTLQAVCCSAMCCCNSLCRDTFTSTFSLLV